MKRHEIRVKSDSISPEPRPQRVSVDLNVVRMRIPAFTERNKTDYFFIFKHSRKFSGSQVEKNQVIK